MHKPLSVLNVLALALCLRAPAAAQEKVSFAADDGQPLTGTLVKPTGTPKYGVVLLHMYKSGRTAFDPLLARLGQAGAIALAVDMRGHGDSMKDKDGRPISVERAVTAKPDTNPFLLMWQDADAALKVLTDHGAPPDRLAVIGASIGASVALHLATRSPDRPRAIILMSPGTDYMEMPSLEHAKSVAPRPILMLSSEEEADHGARALKEAMPFEAAEVRIVEGHLVHGTAMFGKVPAIEATITDWLETVMSAPSLIEIGEAKTVIIDGELTDGEAPKGKVLQVPITTAQQASVRLSHNRRRLDVGFDIPEAYVRLNEVVIFIDGSGKGGRLPDEHCYRVSFCPKNAARKPILVQRGGLKGFEDTDEKGVIAFARTEAKRRWSAEISLDLSRFAPGEIPKTARLAFQVNGQRTTDIRNFPENASVPTTPKVWAPVKLQ